MFFVNLANINFSVFSLVRYHVVCLCLFLVFYFVHLGFLYEAFNCVNVYVSLDVFHSFGTIASVRLLKLRLYCVSLILISLFYIFIYLRHRWCCLLG